MARFLPDLAGTLEDVFRIDTVLIKDNVGVVEFRDKSGGALVDIAAADADFGSGFTDTVVSILHGSGSPVTPHFGCIAWSGGSYIQEYDDPLLPDAGYFRVVGSAPETAFHGTGGAVIARHQASIAQFSYADGHISYSDIDGDVNIDVGLDMSNDIGGSTRLDVRGRTHLRGGDQVIASFSNVPSGSGGPLVLWGVSEGFVFGYSSDRDTKPNDTDNILSIYSRSGQTTIELGRGVHRLSRLTRASGTGAMIGLGRDQSNTGTTTTLVRVINRNPTATLALTGSARYFEVIDYNTTLSSTTDIFSIDNARIVRVYTGTEATDTSSGAFQVVGGAAVAKNLVVGKYLIPLGNQTITSSIAIGNNAGTVDGDETDTVVIGDGAYADNNYATVIGSNAFQDGGESNIVIGDYSFVNGENSVSLGSYCRVGDDAATSRSIHIGSSAIRGNHDDSNGIGYGSYLYGARTQALGNYQRNSFTEALASDQILLGHGAAWSGSNTLQIGGSGCRLAVTGKTGNFIDGEVITGATSGATARAVDNAFDNNLSLAMTSVANFQVGETITGSSSGHTAIIFTVDYATYTSNINAVRFNRGVETISFVNPLSFAEGIEGDLTVTGNLNVGLDVSTNQVNIEDGKAYLYGTRWEVYPDVGDGFGLYGSDDGSASTFTLESLSSGIVWRAYANRQVRFFGGISSTDTTSGTVVVTGGAAISGALNVAAQGATAGSYSTFAETNANNFIRLGYTGNSTNGSPKGYLWVSRSPPGSEKYAAICGQIIGAGPGNTAGIQGFIKGGSGNAAAIYGAARFDPGTARKVVSGLFSDLKNDLDGAFGILGPKWIAGTRTGVVGAAVYNDGDNLVHIGVYGYAANGVNENWAGYFDGDVAIAGYLVSSVQSVDASATIAASRVKFTGSTASQTLTLPAGTIGKDIYIRNAASVAVTVARAGSDTIEGATTFNLNPGEAICLTFVGTDWTVF